jgi:hypothetical protein
MPPKAKPRKPTKPRKPAISNELLGAGQTVVDATENTMLYGGGRLYGTGRVVHKKNNTIRSNGIYGGPVFKILMK